MNFTLTFIELFFLSINLVLPLLFFLFFIITVLGLLVCTIEKWKWFDGLYWAFITATTVGYGDIRPLQRSSKIISVFIALIGMIFTGIIIAIALNTTSVTIDKHTPPSMIEVIKEKIQNK
jgi:voltage-gated potassium channel